MLNDNSLVSEKFPPLNFQRVRLSFGDPIIDNCLDGGILPRAITEIAGEAGSGKTQLCLQLSLQVQLPIERGY